MLIENLNHLKVCLHSVKSQDISFQNGISTLNPQRSHFSDDMFVFDYNLTAAVAEWLGRVTP